MPRPTYWPSQRHVQLWQRFGDHELRHRTTSDNLELREARRRIKLLEQENEVLRRAAAYLSQANLPGGSGKASTRS